MRYIKMYDELLVTQSSNINSFTTSLLYALLGISIVILLIAILFLLIILIVPLISKISKGKKKKQNKEPSDIPIATITTNTIDDSQIVAAIIAAISASENIPINSFRVVSFKKI